MQKLNIYSKKPRDRRDFQFTSLLSYFNIRYYRGTHFSCRIQFQTILIITIAFFRDQKDDHPSKGNGTRSVYYNVRQKGQIPDFDINFDKIGLFGTLNFYL